MNMNRPKISVIIPVYNAARYLPECLNSIIDQSFQDLEIICINDGSSDNSFDIINDFSKKDDRIKYFSLSHNSGSGIARNKGLDLAMGNYISFIDSDDLIIDDQAYEKLYQFAIENEANVVCANLKELTSDSKLHDSDVSRKITRMKSILPEEYGKPWFFVRNLFMREFLIDNNIKFPSYKRGQDAVFLSKVLANVDFIYCLPIDFYAYRCPDSKTPYKSLNDEKEFDYIKHYFDVFKILNEERFNKLVYEYENDLLSFLVNQKYFFSSKSLENNFESVFRDKKRIMWAYNLLSESKEKDYAIEYFHNQVSHKDDAIEHLNSQLTQKDITIKDLKSQLIEKERIIQKLISSRSWRLTKPLRSISNSFKKD